MKRWLWISAPFLLSLIAGFFLETFVRDLPFFYIRANLSAWIFLLGLAISGLAALAAALWDYRQQQFQERMLESERKAEADKYRFLRRLDHELKNPLTAIQAGLVNLQTNDTEPEVLDSIRAQTLRLGRLVSDLRKLTELETLEIEQECVNISTLLEDITGMIRELPETSERQLRLSIPQAPWPLPQVRGDQDLLFLAIHNLISNAVKFTLPGDAIEVRASENGSMVVIEVADTGPGIPLQDQPHVWQELYRGKNARGTAGSGLGLALVKTVTARHGGTVDLRSRVDQGTVVTIRLPSDDVTNS